MKTIKFNNTNLSEVVEQAGQVLRRGGVIVYPTDTVYGLGADPFSKEAIGKIMRIKGRLASKGILIVISNSDQLNKVARVTPDEEKVTKKYWPGRVTIVFEKTDIVSKFLTGDRDTVAIRQPKNEFVKNLLDIFDNPITSTSANRSERPVCLTIEDVLKQLGNSAREIDLIIDAGRLPQSLPSTIIRVVAGQINVLRDGAVKITDKHV